MDEVKFGDWLIEPQLNRIRRGDQEQLLEPLTMNVLAYLVENAGDVVSQDALLQHFWPGRFVEESTIHRRINQIRRALGDDAKHPIYIETISKRGYRTIASVSPILDVRKTGSADLLSALEAHTPPFPAYEGDEPYVFVCYAHADRAVIYPELVRLRDAGVNVWYDEGISPGSEWTEEIADAINGCSQFLYYVSPASVESRNCRDEVAFVHDLGKPMITVHLELTELRGGLRLSIGTTQALLKYDIAGQDYWRKLLAVLDVQGPPAGPSTPSRVLPEQRIDATPGRAPAIAVTTFSSLSQDPEDQFLAIGLSEDLVNELAQSYYRLAVVPEEEVATLPDSIKYRLSGSVRRMGSRLRISVQLIETQSGAQVVGESFDTTPDEIFDVADQIVEIIVGRTISTALRDSERRLARQRPDNLDAWSLVVKSFAPPLRPIASRQDAIYRRGLLKKAIELDPNYGFAYAGMSNALTEDFAAGYLIETGDHGQEALRMAERAIELAPDDPLVLAYCSSALRTFDDVSRALEVTARAYKLSPHHPDVVHRYAVALTWNGKADRAVEILEANVGHEPHLQHELVRAHSAVGNYEQAARYGKEFLSRKPRNFDTAIYYANALAALGRTDEAMQAVELIRAVHPRWQPNLKWSNRWHRSAELTERLTCGLRLLQLT